MNWIKTMAAAEIRQEMRRRGYRFRLADADLVGACDNGSAASFFYPNGELAGAGVGRTDEEAIRAAATDVFKDS